LGSLAVAIPIALHCFVSYAKQYRRALVFVASFTLLCCPAHVTQRTLLI
jgi:hypothetical protein